MPVIPSSEQVAQIFDDARVRHLASVAKLPPNADLQRFADDVRDAARAYALRRRNATLAFS